MAADAAKSFRPKILYPYHTLFGPGQVSGFLKLMKGVEGLKSATTSEAYPRARGGYPSARIVYGQN
jgi:hypothetical protein